MWFTEHILTAYALHDSFHHSARYIACVLCRIVDITEDVTRLYLLVDSLLRYDATSSPFLTFLG
jgi:hypothetical protein